MHTQQLPNPLGEYLESLLKVQNLGVDEVLPAHEYRFADLRRALDEIIPTTPTAWPRSRQVIATPGISCWDITLPLHWSRPWDEIPPFMHRAANGETLAHLMVLLAAGRVARHGGEPWRWEPPAV